MAPRKKKKKQSEFLDFIDEEIDNTNAKMVQEFRKAAQEFRTTIKGLKDLTKAAASQKQITDRLVKLEKRVDDNFTRSHNTEKEILDAQKELNTKVTNVLSVDIPELKRKITQMGMEMKQGARRDVEIARAVNDNVKRTGQVPAMVGGALQGFFLGGVFKTILTKVAVPLLAVAVGGYVVNEIVAYFTGKNFLKSFKDKLVKGTGIFGDKDPNKKSESINNLLGTFGSEKKKKQDQEESHQFVAKLEGDWEKLRDTRQGGAGPSGQAVIDTNTNKRGDNVGDIHATPQKVTGSASEAMSFFQSKGWSKAQAAAIVGNLQVESANFAPDVLSGARKGDGGSAVGVAQWHPDRQRNFEREFKKPLIGASFKEQLEFVNWELNNTEKRAGDLLRKYTDAASAAAMLDKMYERSSGAHVAKRMANARQLANTEFASDKNETKSSPTKVSASGVTPNSGSSPTTNQTSASKLPSGDIVGLGHALQKEGIRVSEHPAFGKVGKHADGSAHYRGEAIDINAPGKPMVEAQDPEWGAKFDKLAEELRSAGYKVIWRAPGHYNHIHAQLGKGGGTQMAETKQHVHAQINTDNDARGVKMGDMVPEPASQKKCSCAEPIAQPPISTPTHQPGMGMMPGNMMGMMPGMGGGMMGMMTSLLSSGILQNLISSPKTYNLDSLSSTQQNQAPIIINAPQQQQQPRVRSGASSGQSDMGNTPVSARPNWLSHLSGLLDATTTSGDPHYYGTGPATSRLG